MTGSAQPDSDILAEFKAACAALGVDFDGPPVGDGKMHRVDIKGRGRGKKHGWYILHLDHPASGAFGDWKTGLEDTWSSKRPQQMTPAERQAIAKRMAETQAQRETERKEAADTAAAAGEAIWSACQPAAADHPYLTRKGVLPLNARTAVTAVKYKVKDEVRPNRTIPKGSLVIRMYNPEGKTRGVQYIAEDGKKLFLFGSEKRGIYSSIGKMTDTVLIGEGWATMATAHMATGLCCIVAFDAGNLLSVAKAIRAKYPDKRIVITADNDHMTREPVDNPGLTKAIEAATEISADVAWPELPAGDLGTDFNDLHVVAGLPAVKARIDAAVPPDQVRRPSNIVSLAEVRASRDDDPPPADKMPDGPGPDEYGAGYPSVGPDAYQDPVPLGYTKPGPVYYFLSPSTKQVFELGPNQFGQSYMMSLAPLAYWEMHYPGKKDVDWRAAEDHLKTSCTMRGIFDPDRVVGRGVMLDKGRVVLHLGDKLIVDNRVNGGDRPTLVLENSDHVYELAKGFGLPRCKPLTADEAAALDEALGELSWRTSDMAAIFAGWLVTAPLCGAMRWRPHLWLTGERGSGKSWVVSQIAQRVLGALAVSVQGVTTEAGIRGKLGSDALPVVFDEAESQNDRARERIQTILDLARQASSESGGAIVKGTTSGKSVSYKIRSMFLFASVNMGATQAADLSRIIHLQLMGADPKRLTADQKRERGEKFRYIERTFTKLLANDFGSRLFARSLKLVKVIRENADTFATALAEQNGSQRLADTLATPLAGWWSLRSDDLLTLDQARAVVAEQGWAETSVERSSADADHDLALAHLLEQTLHRTPSDVDSVGNLIYRASQAEFPGSRRPHDKNVSDLLEIHGIRVIPGDEKPGAGEVWFATRHDKLTAMFARSPWAQTYGSVLEQHPGATKLPRMRVDRQQKTVLAFSIADIIAADE